MNSLSPTLTTPKHFRRVLPQDEARLPTGVWEYKRIELRQLFPQLGSIPLSVYYLLRIACCAHLQVAGESKLVDCEVCRHNHGWVCPRCLGSTWLSYPDGSPWMIRCPDCTYDHTDDKGKIVSSYDEAAELNSVRTWLARSFPFGVPHDPTEADLPLLDSYAGRANRRG